MTKYLESNTSEQEENTPTPFEKTPISLIKKWPKLLELSKIFTQATRILKEQSFLAHNYIKRKYVMKEVEH